MVVVLDHAFLGASLVTLTMWRLSTIDASTPIWLLVGLIRRGSYKPEPGWGKFILQVAAGTLVLAALLAWGSYYFDWIGLRAQRLQRIGLLAALIAGAGLLYFAVLAAVGVRPRSFMRR